MVSVDPNKIRALMQQVLADKGVVAEACSHVSDSLTNTSLRGVDSHGINLFPHYCRAVDAERIKREPAMQMNDTGESAAWLDADHAFGHHAGATAMDHAIAKAKATGIAIVNVRNSTHFGAAAYFGLRAAEQNCLGFAFTNADALVKAFSSSDAFFGTNPICFTAPMANEEPFCLDMATSLVSWNKIMNYRREGTTLPEDWAYDKTGAAVTDPDAAASLAPIGLYKGFGLGMMVDILCGVLAGGLISKDLMAMYTSPIEARRMISHCFMAISVEKFLDADAFRNQMQDMADRIRQMPQSGNEDMMVAGDPEKKMAVIRAQEGIPMDQVKFDEFVETDERFREVLL
jgi:ureidoglycolate dehydrogenase (NAD+)